MSPDLPLVGVHPIATDRSMPLIDLAREVEARGLKSLYLPEHTHVPIGSEELPNGYRLDLAYRRVLDPFIGSAMIAAATTLEVGAGISLVAQHDPIALAKAVATLDHLSGGRMVLGVGFGSNLAEAADHGVAADARVPTLERNIRLMRALWSEDEAEIRPGAARAWAWPKPISGPPVLLGSRAGARTFARIVDWADGWLPVGADVGDPSFATALAELRARWQDAGRVGDPQVCYFFYPGSADVVRRQLETGAELGIQRMQLSIGDRDRELALVELDRLAAVIGSIATSGRNIRS